MTRKKIIPVNLSSGAIGRLDEFVDDLLLLIFRLLSAKDLLVLRLVCKRFFKLSRHESLTQLSFSKAIDPHKPIVWRSLGLKPLNQELAGIKKAYDSIRLVPGSSGQEKKFMVVMINSELSCIAVQRPSKAVLNRFIGEADIVPGQNPIVNLLTCIPVQLPPKEKVNFDTITDISIRENIISILLKGGSKKDKSAAFVTVHAFPDNQENPQCLLPPVKIDILPRRICQLTAQAVVLGADNTLSYFQISDKKKVVSLCKLDGNIHSLERISDQSILAATKNAVYLITITTTPKLKAAVREIYHLKGEIRTARMVNERSILVGDSVTVFYVNLESGKIEHSQELPVASTQLFLTQDFIIAEGERGVSNIPYRILNRASLTPCQGGEVSFHEPAYAVVQDKNTLFFMSEGLCRAISLTQNNPS